MYVDGGCNKCDFSEPDRGYGPVKCSPEYCGGYIPIPVEAGIFEEIYKLIEQKSGKKKLFDTIEDFNIFYGLNEDLGGVHNV